MKKVFILAPNENWICDQIAKDYRDQFPDHVTSLNDCTVIWLLADWCADQIPIEIFHQRKILTTIHHIVPEKFDAIALKAFKYRDEYTNAYHVPNEHTKRFVEKLTNKKIYLAPYWGNHKIWYRLNEQTRSEVRRQIGADRDTLVVFSAQRDTEGRDLVTPKLEKGPDLFADYIEKLHKKTSNMVVLLAGWRRQYIISRLKAANIRYYYEELPSQYRVNQLYNAADLYPVTSRYEGGPQSLIECALTEVQVVSRHVGMAEMMLPASAVNDNVSLAIPAVPKLRDDQKMPQCFKHYNKMFEEL